eukprot:6739207-Pyramimonas_sp.AAC.1
MLAGGGGHVRTVRFGMRKETEPICYKCCPDALAPPQARGGHRRVGHGQEAEQREAQVQHGPLS